MPMFYRKPDGTKTDAGIYEQIIAEGDAEAATEVSRQWLREQGYSEQQIALLLPQPTTDAVDWEEGQHPRGHGGRFSFGRGDRVQSPHGPGIVTSAVRGTEGNRHFVRHDTPVEGQVGRMYHESELQHAESNVRPLTEVSAQQELRRRVEGTTPEQRERLKGMSRAEIVREANAARRRRDE